MTHVLSRSQRDSVVLSIPSAHHRPPDRPMTETTMPPLGDILTAEQAADRMNMSVRYVRRLVAERRIPFHRIGRSIRLTSTDVDAHVAAGRVEPLTVSEVWSGMRSVV